MKKIVFILACFIAASVSAIAQAPVVIEPAHFSADDTITITFRADLGNKGLQGYTGDVYLYAGAITDSSTNANNWRHVTPANWGTFDASAMLTRTGTNTYTKRMVARSYFNLGDEQLKGLMLLFRSSNGNLVGREGGDADIYMPANSAMNWWNETPFYQIFVRSFQDSNGDGIGDFNGIRMRIPYLKSLGVGTVWLMPIHPSNTYHGYDVADYKGVNTDYGTKEQFKQMVDSLHAHGIKVIIDWVMNHSSSAHPWFTRAVAGDAHFRNFYRWRDTLPNQVGPWGAPCWRPNATNNKYYYAIFDTQMPDLNYDYPPVKDSIFSAAKYWLKDVGIDGFRCDAVIYLTERGDSLMNTASTRQIWSDFKRDYESYAPNAMTVGEAWQDSELIKLYNNRLNFCFEFNAASGLLYRVNSNTAKDVADLLAYYITSLYPENQYGTFLTNHDQNRAYNQLGNSYIKCRNAASLLLTITGIPFMYYGEELGVSGYGPDEDKRVPMPWTGTGNGGFTSGVPWRGFPDNKAVANVASQENDPSSLLNHYRKLISVRNEFPALRKGQIFNAKTDTIGPVGMYYRFYANQSVIVAVNPSNASVSGVKAFNWFGQQTSGTIRLKNQYNGVVQAYTISFNAALNASVINIPTLLPNEIRILTITNEAITAIEPRAVQSTVQLFPVPSTDYVNIALPADVNQASYVIHDMAGRTVQEGVINAEKTAISGLSSGMYSIQIALPTTKWQGKIVIK